MRIGLDLDGVIVDSIPHWIRVLNREAGTTYVEGNLPDSHGQPEIAAVSDRFEVEMLIPPGPVPGAREAVRQLKEAGHILVVITARSPRMRGLTEAWLAYHGISVDRLRFLGGGNKADAAIAEGIELFVEDTPHNAQALAEAGVEVLLFEEPYNRSFRHPLAHHCRGWEAVLAEIEARRIRQEEQTA